MSILVDRFYNGVNVMGVEIISGVFETLIIEVNSNNFWDSKIIRYNKQIQITTLKNLIHKFPVFNKLYFRSVKQLDTECLYLNNKYKHYNSQNFVNDYLGTNFLTQDLYFILQDKFHLFNKIRISTNMLEKPLKIPCDMVFVTSPHANLCAFEYVFDLITLQLFFLPPELR